MFGKPEWFRPKTTGWGLVPITRQGWLYTLVWLVVLLAPFALLMTLGKHVESVVWLATAIGGLTWDARSIMKSMNCVAAQEEDLFVIDENETESTRLATRNYEMHLRD